MLNVHCKVFIIVVEIMDINEIYTVRLSYGAHVTILCIHKHKKNLSGGNK